tara:strand:+ start:1584 stop:2174 length:591 start_codon:yes stop_codon:yes gene_type:complete
METKRPPRVSDPETSNAVNQIYDDLNAIANAVGTGQGQTHREGSSTEGEVGDIKIGRAGLGKYAVMAKTEDGWVESDELSFMDKKSKASLWEETGSSSSETSDGITESSLDTDGFAKFGNGFIMQWGTQEIGSNSTVAITLPIAFPSQALNVVATMGTTGNHDYSSNIGASCTTTVVTIRNNSGSAYNINWFAIGY